MIALLLSALLLGSDGGGTKPDEPPAPPDPARIEATCSALESALGGKDVEALAKALADAAKVPDARVVALVAKAVKRDEPGVREAALGALRFLDHPDALEVLHATYEKDEKLRRDPDLGVLLLKAIGQHASASSIDVLSDDPFSTPTEKATQARIYALGRIRDARSVAALFELMQKAGPRNPRRDDGPYMNHFRVALMLLTGTDQGTSRDRWVRWWNDHKHGFAVSEQPAPLPDDVQLAWDRYWGIRRHAPPRERREDRGRRGE